MATNADALLEKPFKTDHVSATADQTNSLMPTDAATPVLSTNNLRMADANVLKDIKESASSVSSCAEPTNMSSMTDVSHAPSTQFTTRLSDSVCAHPANT